MPTTTNDYKLPSPFTLYSQEVLKVLEQQFWDY